MADCVFCAIVAGSSPAAVVAETDETIAFLDVRPLSPGHTLVVPKAHAARLSGLDGAHGTAMFALGHRLGRAAQAGPLAADGVNLVVNDGRVAMQTVDHVHLHVIPRFSGDKLRWLSRMAVRRPRSSDDAVAALRAGLEGLQP